MVAATNFPEHWTITDDTPMEHKAVGGNQGFGLVARDVEQFPCYGGAPSEIRVYPRIEWPERIKEKVAKRSRCSDIRNRGGKDGGPIPYLNQGNWGYCWAHSATHAVMLMRARADLDYVPLSAFSAAGSIMNGKNQGGWAALAFDWMMKNGVAPQSLWPQLNASPSLWTAACQAEAAKYKIYEGWWDASIHPGLRKLTFDQFASLLLDSIPTVAEFNWWSHSVLALDLIEVNAALDLTDPNRWGIDILNSWLNYGINGVGRIVGSRARPDSSVACTGVQPV